MSFDESYIQIPKSQWESLLARLEVLETANKALIEENDKLRARIKKLEGKQAKDSSNSSKPPSSDGLKRKNRKEIKNSRDSSGNFKPGAQKGHEGSTLKIVEKPDHIEEHRVSHCEECGGNLVDDGGSFQRRQVFDIPAIKFEVTEHRVYSQRCTCCETKQKAVFPAEVGQPAQYGDRIKALCVYLNTYQFIPYMRLRELIEDLSGQRVSPGSIGNWIEECWNKLEPYEAEIIDRLLNAMVLHSDESGMRREGATHWVHVVSTELFTWFGIHPNRGREAVEAFGILPNFTGTVVHDRYSTYFTYFFTHALCNAHILRELKYFFETRKLEWANELAILLKGANKSKKKGELTQPLIAETITRFEVIVARELKKIREMPPLPRKGKRGRAPKNEEHRLLEAFEKHQESFLRFLLDPEVPFDNNQAERDLRMVKLKQKISGCFRSDKGGEHFCRIRGYLSTIRKNGLAALGQIEKAFQGNPFIPPEMAV